MRSFYAIDSPINLLSNFYDLRNKMQKKKMTKKCKKKKSITVRGKGRKKTTLSTSQQNSNQQLQLNTAKQYPDR